MFIAVGIRLTKNMSIHPQKSISDIYFVSENGFCNCSFCPRERCIARKLPPISGVGQPEQRLLIVRLISYNRGEAKFE